MIIRVLLAIGTWLASALPLGGSDPAAAEYFELRIRPLLAENCYACHTSARKGDLRLDSREELVRGGSSGPAIRPGNSAASLLIRVVSHTHEQLQMPPQGKLSDQKVEDLRSWIDAGAVWPDTGDKLIASAPAATYTVTPEQRAFWSLRPLQVTNPPPVTSTSRPRSPIDYFVLDRLEKEGLAPVGAADRRTLIRRASFDLIGLPPTPEEVEAFVGDTSPNAFSRVVERLLGSRHYGERWGRHWLDLARYSDGRLGARTDTPYPNAFRYRDWVVEAFNRDLPYDQFVLAQVAADQLPPEVREELLAGLGFLVVAPNLDDLVDVTARTFLGLTVGCARCHDHKYDPIPTQDFYSLKGVFTSSKAAEHPLVADSIVQAYKKSQERINAQKEAIQAFIKSQSQQLAEILMGRTSDYMVAAWKVMKENPLPPSADLDSEIMERWVKYLGRTDLEHPYLREWEELRSQGGILQKVNDLSRRFQDVVLAVNSEKKAIEDRNYVKLGGAKGVADQGTRQFTNLEFLDLEKWYLWRDLASEPHPRGSFRFPGGVFYYGAEEGLEIDRFLSPVWKGHLDRMRAELKRLEESGPEPYPFLHSYQDQEKPEDLRIAIRGDKKNLGEVAPRRFLHIVSDGTPKNFGGGSGRLELARAIADSRNPLTARVMVNRIWQHHFGSGIIPTPSNLGRLGEPASHPRLLDYLAARFIRSGWSVKQLHREIMLSSTYAMSSRHRQENFEKDPQNRLLWRMNPVPRLDAEALRDTILAVSGKLDRKPGGPPAPLDEKHRRRTLYATVSRTQPDRTLALFDFPDPNAHSDRRSVTVGPMQRLFFLNSPFVMEQAEALARRLARESPQGGRARIRRAYSLLYGRPPEPDEIRMGLEYLEGEKDPWPKYAQMLLASSEFSSVN